MKITLVKNPGRRGLQLRVSGPGGVNLNEAEAVAKVLQDWVAGLPPAESSVTISDGQVTFQASHHFAEELLVEFGKWLDLWRIQHDIPTPKKRAKRRKVRPGQIEIDFSASTAEVVSEQQDENSSQELLIGV